MTQPARTAVIALIAAVLAAAAVLIATPPEAAAQDRNNSPCRKDTGVVYPGGKGAPKFTGIPNAGSYEPVTAAVGSRTVVRNLIEVYNLSASDCGWRVVSKDADWVSLSIESGTLGPDKHDNIRVSVNGNARSLRPGTYKARIKFQLGPEADKWHGYAVVHLEVLDKCHIKVRDATRLDIKDQGRITRWRGVMGRPTESPLEHRIVVWNPSNSRCDLSVEPSVSWLNAEFEGQTDIGRFGEAGLMLSANDRWNYLEPGKHQAAITIRDAISGGDYHLYLTLETEHQPCELVVEGVEQLQFEATARSVPSQETVIHLVNRGVESCEWGARSDAPWLTVTPDGGNLLGKSFKDSVTIAIAGNAANGLRSDNGQPHLGAVTFYYIKGGITETEAVPVSLRLAKPPCHLRADTPEEMAIHYNPGETVNPARHHLTISLSNEPDSEECRYQAELPNWLASDDRAGIIPEGESRDIIVRLKDDTPEAQAGQQKYDDIIAIAVGDAPAAAVPVSLETGCPAREACAYLHTTHTEISVGETAEMAYAVNNTSNRIVTARLTLEVPLGWAIDGEGFADKCSGICTATHEVPPHDQRDISIKAYPNQPGPSVLKGRAEYVNVNGSTDPYAPSESEVAITVLPRKSEPTPLPPPAAILQPAATPEPTPTPEPMPVVAAAAPTPANDAFAAMGMAESAIAPAPAPAPATDLSSIYSALRALIGAVVLLFIFLVVIVVILVVVLVRRGRRPQVVVAHQTSRRPPPDNRGATGSAAPNQPG